MKPKTNDVFFQILKQRFMQHVFRHPDVAWEYVEGKLHGSASLVRVVFAMEESGGEPDVMNFDDKLLFVDFSKETPAKRRSICYDRAARESRKKFPPQSSAEEVAEQIGIAILDESMYFALQELGEFDEKTSSWLKTPMEIRRLGGALFGDRRYSRVFSYHNGADSYYNTRGFRGFVEIV